MKKMVTREVGGEIKKIGYECMMAPCHVREKGKVFKTLQLCAKNPDYLGDIHFFEKRGEKWILIADYSFVCITDNSILIDLYMNLPRHKAIEFDVFVDLVSHSLNTL